MIAFTAHIVYKPNYQDDGESSNEELSGEDVVEAYIHVVRSVWQFFIDNMLCKMSSQDVETCGLYALKTGCKDVKQDFPHIVEHSASEATAPFQNQAPYSFHYLSMCLFIFWN